MINAPPRIPATMPIIAPVLSPELLGGALLEAEEVLLVLSSTKKSDRAEIGLPEEPAVETGRVGVLVIVVI
jgi:hypothetical protein